MTEYKGKQNIEQELRVVIRHILSLIESGEAEPGGRLPAERKMAEATGVSRAKVRLALEKLESFGLVRILPQSGSVLLSCPRAALINQFSNFLDVTRFDFYSLVKVRTLLEAESVRLCALNHNEEDIQILRGALKDFEDHVLTPHRDEKDFAFHTAIAKCSHNPVLYHLLLIITTDVLGFYRRLRACAVSPEQVLKEHRLILEMIEKGDADGAVKALHSHFEDITNFASGNPCEIPRFMF